MRRGLIKLSAKFVALLTALTIVGLPLAYLILLLVEVLEELEKKK